MSAGPASPSVEADQTFVALPLMTIFLEDTLKFL